MAGDINDQFIIQDGRSQPMGIAYPMMSDVRAHFINGLGMLTHKAKTSF